MGGGRRGSRGGGGAAFPAFAATSREERLDLWRAFSTPTRSATTTWPGPSAPRWARRSRRWPAAARRVRGWPISRPRRALRDFSRKKPGQHRILREPIGVCALITPWNWPANQMACKVAPALAAGCTMVLKPSELAPLSAIILAEILDDAGVPAGVFNLVNGDGAGVGAPCRPIRTWTWCPSPARPAPASW
jgi:acyl-CoA reductase-like NAD-dependent aldehyde dehydrogenase